MKMLRILSAVLLFTFTCQLVVAQNFMHSGGFTLIRGKTKASNENGGVIEKMTINGITYFPRVVLVHGQEQSISICLPLTLGLRSNPGIGTSSTSFGMDAPLVIDYNLGHKSSTASQRLIGGYVGAGFGFTHVALTETSSFGTYAPDGISYGPLARAGFRFGIKAGKEVLTFTIGGYYKYGLEKDSFKSGGVSLLIDFKVVTGKRKTGNK